MTEAVEYLNRHTFTVLYSGGKDSTATLLWVLDNVMHDRWNILYVEVTGNTARECTEYVKYISKILGVEDKLIIAKREVDFFDYLKRCGSPLLSKYRWCYWQFKWRLFKRYALPINVTGMKKRDSWRRRKVKEIDTLYMDGVTAVNPIVAWSNNKVLEYIRDHGIPLNPCYEKYGHSGNCMFCPNHSKHQIILTMQDPYWRRKILNALKYGRGYISRRVYNKWMEYSRIKTLL